jgi:hypothetical protein
MADPARVADQPLHRIGSQLVTLPQSWQRRKLVIEYSVPELLNENEGDGGADLYGLSRGFQPSGFGINRKYDEIPGILIASHQVFAGGIDLEAARLLSASQHVLYQRQRAAFLVDCEYRDAVVPAI